MTRQEYTDNYKNKVLFDTRIHEELLLREPVKQTIRENKEKKELRSL